MLRRLIFIAYDFNKHMSKKNISAFAASTAFFLFLSLIPMLMLLCNLIDIDADLLYLGGLRPWGCWDTGRSAASSWA